MDVHCRIELAAKGYVPPDSSSTPGNPAQFTVGLEMVINLLAPNVPDRYHRIRGREKTAGMERRGRGSRVRFVDEWQDVAVEIEARGASQLWISPIETVSESEEGFERVYQGSQILGVWNVTLSPAEPWSAETVLHASKARAPK